MFALGITSIVSAQSCNDLSSNVVEGFENGLGNFTIVDNNGGNTWEVYNSIYSANTGSYSLRYNYLSSLPADDIAFTECLDLQTGESYELTFSSKAYNNSGYPEKMMVIITTDTTAASSVDTILDWNPVSHSSYLETIKAISVNSSGQYYIGFHVYSDANMYSMYIDDIEIRKIVPAEAGLISINSSASDGCGLSTSETVSIQFSNNGTDSINTIDIQLDVNGVSSTETYVPSTGIAPGDTATYTFYNVDMSTPNLYNIEAVIMLNGDANSLNDSMSMTVNHLSAAVTPLTENFEAMNSGAAASLNLLWNTSSSDGTYAWTVDNAGTASSDTGPADDLSGGGNYIYTEASLADNSAVAELKSQCIDLTGLGNPTLEFYYHMYGDEMGTLEIQISTDYVSYTVLDSIVGEQHSADTDPWTKKQISLTAYIGQTVYLNFVSTKTASNSAYKGDMALDEISIIDLANKDLKVNAVYLSEAACNLSASETVSAMITNNGLDTVYTFEISYWVNNQTVAFFNETVNDTLAFGESMTYTFINTADMSSVGNYNVVVYTNLQGDANSTNDTASSSTESYFGSLSLSNSTVSPILDDTANSYELTFCGLPATLDSCFKIHSLTIDSLEHSYLGDLDIYLVSPSNDTLEISTDNGGSGDDLINVVFTDTANTNISTSTVGVSPGYYHTEDSMGFEKFNGTNPNGVWTLQVNDDDAYASGTIHSWSLNFENCVITSQNIIISNDLINIYPNPAKDYMIIDLVDESQISVYNISGQLVHAFEANTQSIVNTKDWNKGIYFINIQSNNGNIQKKIVVE